MGKHKGNMLNLFESYLASGLVQQSPVSNASSSFIPLPDSMRTSTLLEQIGQERRWTEDQMNQDIVILEENRLYYVSDLRELSKSSWKVIALLPIVKDLLRKAIRTQEQPPSLEKTNGSRMLSTAVIADEPYHKIDKKSRKQYKKEKKRERKRLKEKSHKVESTEPVLNQNPETVRNTMQNLTIEHRMTDDNSHSTTLQAEDMTMKKKIPFSSELPVNMTEQQPDNMSVSSSSSNSSSSSSSSNSSSIDDNSGEKFCQNKGIIAYEDTPAATAAAATSSPMSGINHSVPATSLSTESMTLDTHNSSTQNPKVFFGRPIKAISGNRIRVRAGDGDIFEVDRWCPHKNVDMATWGQVMGRTLICTKHNWRFALDGFPLTKGKSIHPCKVNDW